jgi:hypothetical protein
MFNINIIWNPNHIIKSFQKSIFTIESYHYDYIEGKIDGYEKNYVLTIKYKSDGFKIKPVIIKHPKYNIDCMVLFFEKTDINVNELVIDTRIVKYCDFVDYIHDNITNNIVEKQEKYWQLYQTFGKYTVDMTINESNGNYIFTFTHGMDVKIEYNNNTFTITKTYYQYMELMAYITTHEVPRIDDIKVIVHEL